METNKDLNIHFVRCSETEDGIKLRHPIYGISVYGRENFYVTIKEDSLHTLGMLLEENRVQKGSFEKIELFEFDY